MVDELARRRAARTRTDERARAQATLNLMSVLTGRRLSLADPTPDPNSPPGQVHVLGA
jgi:hypothetical protein